MLTHSSGELLICICLTPPRPNLISHIAETLGIAYCCHGKQRWRKDLWEVPERLPLSLTMDSNRLLTPMELLLVCLDVADWVEFLGFEQYRVRQKSSYLFFQTSAMMRFIARTRASRTLCTFSVFCRFHGLNSWNYVYPFSPKYTVPLCSVHATSWIFSFLCRKKLLLLIHRSC